MGKLEEMMDLMVDSAAEVSRLERRAAANADFLVARTEQVIEDLNSVLHFCPAPVQSVIRQSQRNLAEMVKEVCRE